MPRLTPVEPAWPLAVDDLPRSTVREVRVGGVVDAAGTPTGYAKSVVAGPVALGPLGFAGDEQAASMHGGPDRAVLQVSPGHLADWRDELPDQAGVFVPGCLGENLVVDGMDEWNLCLGDVVAVGTCLLQVTQTRSPCHKINRVLGRADMSRLVQASGRGGWLYRVLQPGTVEAGDEIRVVERPCPNWPLSRFSHHLYDAPFDAAVAEELAGLDVLAASMREKFRARLASGAVESFATRLGIPDDQRQHVWRRLEVVDVEHLSPRLTSIVFAGEDLPRWKPGAHVTVQVANDSWRNDYSLCGPLAAGTWRIVVARDETGQGGSRFLADRTRPGDVLVVSEPVNHFPVHRRAARHLFLAGGVGATVFLPMAEALGEAADWHLHLSVRDQADAALVADLAQAHPARVTVWHSRGASGRVDLACLVSDVDEGTHVYACGSAAYLDAVRAATAHWPHRQVHFEAFAAPVAVEQAFTARIDGTDEVVAVGAGESLLQALRAAGHRVDSDCETGSCAMCVVKVLAGEVDHRDFVLSEDQRAEQMCTCVSRGVGQVTVELPAR